MSATQSWSGPSASNLRRTRSGGALPGAAPCGDGEATPTAEAADAVLPHERRHAPAAHDQPLIDQHGAHARHAVGLVRLSMHLADAFAQHGVGHAARAGPAIAPGLVAAGREPQHLAHRAHLYVGLVRVHEFVDPVDVLPSFAANQVVAFAMAVMLCAETSNSRESCPGLRPAIASSAIWCRNAAGYGGLVLPISDSFFYKDEVSAKSGQLQYVLRRIRTSELASLKVMQIEPGRRCSLQFCSIVNTPLVRGSLEC